MFPKLALLALLAACRPASSDKDDTDAPLDSEDTDAPAGDGTDDDDGGGPTAREDNLNSSAGDFALDFLTEAAFDQVFVEVDHIEGHAPDPAALEGLRAMIEQRCHKSGGIEILVDDVIPDQGGPIWTVPDGEAMEIAWRDRYHDPETGVAVLYVLYLDGNASRDGDNTTTLGYAYHGSSVVLFDESIDTVRGALPLLSGNPERTVLRHELGHILGLVNNGVRMTEDHQDRPYGNHDINDECLMYWAVETGGLADLLLGDEPDLDAACLADLEAAGGRPAR
jgi:hypothetical protein